MKKAAKKNASRRLSNSRYTTATNGRILEVSDNGGVREIVGAICKSLGFTVIQARCGDEALSVYREHSPFKLVLIDLYFYDESGIEPSLSNTRAIRDGIQLALAIRKLTPNQNIVMHTGASQVREQMPKELGDIRILEKPFSREELELLL